MARHDISGFIKFDELTPKEKSELTETNSKERKQVLTDALKVVDRGLKALAKAKKTSQGARRPSNAAAPRR